MKFLSGGEKILKLRKQLKLKQKDFQSENFTRGYLGLLENGKRNITEDAARIITKRFKERANELKIQIDIDERYFLRSLREEADKYCIDELQKKLNFEEISEVMKICDEHELYSAKAKVYLKLGDYYYNNKEYMYAFKNYFYSLDLLKYSADGADKCYIYNSLGMCKYMLLNYEEAILYFNIAKAESFIINEIKIFKDSMYNLALSNKKIGNLKEAIQYIEQVIEMCDVEMELESYVYANAFKANCYEQMGKIEESLSIYKNILPNISDNHFKLLGYLYNNMGELLLKSNNLKEALEYYNKSQQIRNKFDKGVLQRTLIEKASVYIANELYNEALMIIQLGLEEAKKNNDYEYVLKGYELLEYVYEKLEMPEYCEEAVKNIIKLVKEKENILMQLKYHNILLGLYLKQKEYDKVEQCQKDILSLFK